MVLGASMIFLGDLLDVVGAWWGRLLWVLGLMVYVVGAAERVEAKHGV